MKCSKHQEIDAIGLCQSCGNGVCENCKVRIENITYCKDCVEKGLIKPSRGKPIAYRSGDSYGYVSILNGVIGFFFLSIIFGPFAIILGFIAISKKSTKLGSAGIILGLIDVIWGLLLMFFIPVGFLL